jgi:hypothetical protein
MKWLLGVFLVLFPMSGAFAGSLTLLGSGSPGGGGGGGGYSGPGNITSFQMWGSVGRVYTAAGASTSTNLADLVASSGGAAVCTLRGSTSGFVDLTSNYCAGTTPEAACFAAAGSTCSVSKLYDQTGNGNHLTQATLSKMPKIVFEATPNGMPAMACTNAAITAMTATSITQAQPMVTAFVSMRTDIITSAAYIESNSGQFSITALGGSTANQMILYAGLEVTGTVLDNIFSAIQVVGNGTSSFIAANGTNNPTGNAYTNGVVGTLTFCSDHHPDSFTGQIVELGIFGGAFNSTLQSNMRSAYVLQ